MGSEKERKIRTMTVADCIGLTDQEENTLLVALGSLSKGHLLLLAEAGLGALAQGRGLIDLHDALKGSGAAIFFTKEERKKTVAAGLDQALAVIAKKRSLTP